MALPPLLALTFDTRLAACCEQDRVWKSTEGPDGTCPNNHNFQNELFLQPGLVTYKLKSWKVTAWANSELFTGS